MISAYFGIACIVNIDKTLRCLKNVLHLVLEDIYIQNFHFVEVYRRIYGRTFSGLRLRVSGAVKRDFRPYIQ